MAVVPLVLAINPNLAVADVEQLIAFAKTHPNQLNYASQGYGTTGHLAGELFKSMAGIEIVHVPYKGSTPALTDLLGGQVQMMFIELSTVISQINAGKLRALAVGSESRNRFLPDVPAMAEVLPGFRRQPGSGRSLRRERRQRSSEKSRQPFPKPSMNRMWLSGSLTLAPMRLATHPRRWRAFFAKSANVGAR